MGQALGTSADWLWSWCRLGLRPSTSKLLVHVFSLPNAVRSIFTTGSCYRLAVALQQRLPGSSLAWIGSDSLVLCEGTDKPGRRLGLHVVCEVELNLETELDGCEGPQRYLVDVLGIYRSDRDCATFWRKFLRVNGHEFHGLQVYHDTYFDDHSRDTTSQELVDWTVEQIIGQLRPYLPSDGK